MNVAAAYAIDYEHDTECLVRRFAPLVKRIAYHLKGRLPDNVLIDDLLQAGMLGLLEASRNFDESQGASFETFAGIRIRGAMLDDVRKHDWAPRSTHRKAREVAEAVRRVENREGRGALGSEIAEALGVSLIEYHGLLRDAAAFRVTSLDDAGAGSVADRVADDRVGVLDRLQAEDQQAAVAAAIAGLPERERLVMVLYYDEELNLREIGQLLGVTESRVCQIHGQALIRLKARLAEGSTAAW